MKENKKEGESKIRLRPYIKIAFFSSLAFVFIGICLFFSLFFDGYEKYSLIEIPNLYGVYEDDIVLPYGIQLFCSYEDCDGKDAGRVIYQSAIGERKSQGAYPLYIKIGREREKFEVPNLYGIEKDEAVRIISSLGGVANIEYIDNGKSGFVLYQSPKAGTELSVGQKVTIFTSKKVENKSVCVPNLEGLSFSEALLKIEECGLILGDVSYVLCDDMESGIVLSQSIPSGAYIEKSRKINLTVSKQTEINQTKESHKNIWMTKKRAE